MGTESNHLETIVGLRLLLNEKVKDGPVKEAIMNEIEKGACNNGTLHALYTFTNLWRSDMYQSALSAALDLDLSPDLIKVAKKCAYNECKDAGTLLYVKSIPV